MFRVMSIMMVIVIIMLMVILLVVMIRVKNIVDLILYSVCAYVSGLCLQLSPYALLKKSFYKNVTFKIPEEAKKSLITDKCYLPSALATLE